MQLVVGDASGRKLEELEPDVGVLSWRLNEVGRMTFRLPRNGSKTTAVNLAFGNRVMVNFDNGLPSWAGVLDTPRDWQSGMVTCTAYSAEYLLGWRQTDRGRYFENKTVGEIYTSLVNEANIPYSLGITVGDVYLGGIGHYPDYHFDNVLKIVRDSLCGTLSTFDFAVVGSESSTGVIGFTANLYERRGSEKPGVALIEGHNLVSVRFTEQGEIVNSWDLAGAGNGWGDERPYSHEQDDASISTYGFRQGSRVFSDVSVQETLDEHAATLKSENKDPHNMLDLTAIDLAPGLFQDYDVGDSVMVSLVNAGFGGFEGLARVEGREYNPRTGRCKLVVREDV